LTCKVFTKKLLWTNIVHFDNGAYSPTMSDSIAAKLLKHCDELVRMDSLVISRRGDEDVLNELCARLAPRLKRFERHCFTLYIRNEESQLVAFSPKKIEALALPAICSAPIQKKLFCNDLPHLQELHITEQEADEDDDEEYYERESDPLRHVDVPSIRPLLAAIASNACKLRSFKVSVTNIRDEQGFVTDSIKAIALAKKDTLQLLDFTSSVDGAPGLVSVTEASLKWLDIIFNGAVFDSSKWDSLPAAIETTFGVHVSDFRIGGATIWQRVMIHTIIQKCEFPPLEHSRALFDAVYSPDRASAAARINSFEFFLDDTVRIDAESAKKKDGALVEQYRSWMMQTVASNLNDVDIRCVPFKSIALGLAGLVIFLDCCQYDVGELWQRVVAFGSVTDSAFPLNPYFGLAGENLDMGVPFKADRLAKMLLKYRQGDKFDLLAPIGSCSDPLIVYLREAALEVFNAILNDASIFDPLKRHPTAQTPMLLFAFLQPLKQNLKITPAARIIQSFEERYLALSSELQGVSYMPKEHITVDLLRRWPQPPPALKAFLLTLVPKEEHHRFK
jgi:hypothetical protein